ncbi:MAG: cell division protein ZapA [Gemmatimonadaceae bacterium]|nr:cell division protein ZapA [Gemmatimonadaceae bacterium]
MSDKKHLVKVVIVGEEYSIRSDASPEHTRAVAQYVDQSIKRVLNTSMVVENHKAAILAALQITDELFRARASAKSVDEAMDSLALEIRRWLPPAKRGESGDHPAV